MSRSLRSTKFVKRRRNKLIGLSVLTFIALASIIVAITLLSRLPFFQINDIGIVGSDNASIKTKLMPILGGDYFKFIPRSSIFFYPKSELKQKVLSDFKDVESVRIGRSGFSKIIVEINERIPVAILCKGFKDDKDNDCYDLDKDGYIFAKAEKNTGGVIYYSSLLGDGDAIGQSFLTPQNFGKLEGIPDEVKSIGLNPTGILATDGGQYELYANPPSKAGVVNATTGTSTSTTGEFTIYFDDKTPFDRTFSNFVTFWNAQPKKMTQGFDYIDLRFGNNIFYSNK